MDTLRYLSEVHQGATHSVVLLPLWALAVAWIFGRFSGLGWRGYFMPVSLGIGIHIAGDLITAYGTMLFYPLSDWRPALSWVYVVDPYFTLIIAAGLLVAWRRPDRGRTGSVAALVALVAYVGLQGGLQIRAVGIAEVYARHAGLSEALPQPFSPVHRVLVVSDDAAVHTAWVRLLPGRSLAERMPLPHPFRGMATHYMQVPQWQRRPRFGRGSGESDLARLAWGQNGFRYFRRFARIPVLHEVAEEGGRECAWFKDLRFELPALPPSFVFGMCRDPVDGSWYRERRRGAMWLD